MVDNSRKQNGIETVYHGRGSEWGRLGHDVRWGLGHTYLVAADDGQPITYIYIRTVAVEVC